MHSCFTQLQRRNHRSKFVYIQAQKRSPVGSRDPGETHKALLIRPFFFDRSMTGGLGFSIVERAQQTELSRSELR